MCFQVINGKKGQGTCQRQPLGEGRTNNQPANEPRARGCGHRVQRRITNASFIHDLGHQAGQILQMRARGDFGHHTTKGRMFLLLAEHSLGQDGAICAQDRGCCFIAAAFNA